MNKTQKGAWLNLSGCLICMASFGYIYLHFFVLKKGPGITGIWPLLAAYCVFLVLPIVFLHKKQSPHEVAKDERDSLIEKRAVIAAFVSVWILLFAATIIPRFIVGVDGSIAVWCLAFINVGILFIVMLVYSIAILVQYGKGSKL
ncbi:MAG: hypothetical protein FVQ82_08975 [Planctomycetes bacterium]|nr:hypothetical protein [Planctomycetota bacterium]